MLVVLLMIYGVALHYGHSVENARALTFTALVIVNLALIVMNRSWSRTILATLRTSNPAMWWVVGTALAFLALVLYVPFLRALFHLSTLHPVDIGLCAGAGAVSIAWFEALKAFQRWRRP